MDAIKAFLRRWFPIRGLLVGAVAITVAGFAFNWVTLTGTANKMAADRSKEAVVAALTPICVAQAKADPLLKERVAEINDASAYGSARTTKLIDFGWATFPGVDKANDSVAQACIKTLLAPQTS